MTEKPPTDWVDELSEILHPYDAADLLSSVAALQLLPENAEQLLRLEALAQVVAASLRESQHRISRNRLREICNCSPLMDITDGEDPAEQLFTEALSFIGGSYIVFPGIVEDAAFVVRHLSQAIGQLAFQTAPEFVHEANNLLGSVLTLSDLIAKRAGLSRGMAPITATDAVFVPFSRTLHRLKAAVTFDTEEVSDAVRSLGFDPVALEPLMARLGHLSLDGYSLPTCGPLDSQPLVMVGERIIVATPGLLLAPLRHRLLTLAEEYGAFQLLCEKYREAVWQTVIKSLDLLGHRLLPMNLPPLPHGLPILDAVFTMDTDKALYVSVSVDDGRDYNRDKVFGEWDTHGLGRVLEDRQSSVENHLRHQAEGLNEVVALYLTSALGRSYALGFSNTVTSSGDPLVALGVSDLEMIALIEGRNPMVLRNYAIASNEIREEAQVLAFSGLDEYAIYRQAEYSYYLSDDIRPSLISIQPGSGLDLRCEVAHRFDFHAVPAFRTGYVIEVARIAPGVEIPVYTSMQLAMTGQQIAFLVEQLPIGIWVLGPDFEQIPAHNELSLVYFYTADAIAYWLWQFTPSLIPVLSVLENVLSILVIQLHAQPDDAWFVPDGDDSGLVDQSWIACTVDGETGTISVELLPGLMRALMSADNAGERYMMSEILKAIRGLVEARGIDRILGDEQIEDILDAHAPLGPKKKMITLETHTNPAFSTTGLDSYRNVQMAQKSALLDAIGDYLSYEVGIDAGPIASHERTRILKLVVGFLYRQLQALVASLDPTYVLDRLIRHHEALLYDQSMLRLNTPTRLACFGDDPEYREGLIEEVQDINEAAQAARFVIEYVAACPPTGTRPMSLSVYDELQALASEIILWASVSDGIHFGVADTQLSMLPSGRLGSDYDIFIGRIREGFLPLYAAEGIHIAQGTFERHWTPPPRIVEKPTLVQETDSAYQAEFGYTLSDVRTVLTECFALGLDQESPVKKLRVWDMIASLCIATSLPEETLEHMMEDLSLRPRDHFLKPSQPFRPEDVYPWRFGRPLAYLRRPFILHAEDDELAYTWGNLHVHSSMGCITDFCVSGRLQSRAESQELKSLMARLNKERGQEFTQSIADIFRQHEPLEVDTDLKKIGHMRLVENGKNLGDIDVLVINPRRHRVLVIECKDLSRARNAHEMANELTALFVDSEKSTPTVTKHQRRCSWVERNLVPILQHYDLSSRGKWVVESLLVVDEELITPHIHDSPMPMISARTLQKNFLLDWL